MNIDEKETSYEGWKFPSDEVMEKGADVDVLKPKIKQLQYKMRTIMLHTKAMDEHIQESLRQKLNWRSCDDNIKSNYKTMGAAVVKTCELMKRGFKDYYAIYFKKMCASDWDRYDELKKINELISQLVEHYEKRNPNPMPKDCPSTNPKLNVPPNDWCPTMEDIARLEGDMSNKALRITDEELDACDRFADMIGADVRAYMETKGKKKFGHRIPVMVFGDDQGDFLKEITREQKRAYSEGLSVHDYMNSWETHLSTAKPPMVLIVFEPDTYWTAQEIVLEISLFQEWLVVYNELRNAHRFLADRFDVSALRKNYYLEEDTIPNNAVIAFFLCDHNAALIRAFLAQKITKHLRKGEKYWTEL